MGNQSNRAREPISFASSLPYNVQHSISIKNITAMVSALLQCAASCSADWNELQVVHMIQTHFRLLCSALSLIRRFICRVFRSPTDPHSAHCHSPIQSWDSWEREREQRRRATVCGWRAARPTDGSEDWHWLRRAHGNWANPTIGQSARRTRSLQPASRAPARRLMSPLVKPQIRHI